MLLQMEIGVPLVSSCVKVRDDFSVGAKRMVFLGEEGRGFEEVPALGAWTRQGTVWYGMNWL